MDEETTPADKEAAPWDAILARLARIEERVRRLPESNTDRTGLYIMVYMLLIQTCSRG